MKKFKTGQTVKLNKAGSSLASNSHLLDREFKVTGFVESGLISQPTFTVIDVDGELKDVNPDFLDLVENDKFDQKKPKSMNRYEIIGVEKEATKVVQQMFDLERTDLGTAMSNEKLWVDDLDTYNDEFQILKCFYLNEANDMIFMFQDRDEENERFYYLDLSTWNGSFDNPLKLIK